MFLVIYEMWFVSDEPSVLMKIKRKEMFLSVSSILTFLKAEPWCVFILLNTDVNNL